MKRLDWSQTRLAEAMGATPQYVNDYLHRKDPGLDVVQRFAKALEVDPGELLAQEEQEELLESVT